MDNLGKKTNSKTKLIFITIGILLLVLSISLIIYSSVELSELLKNNIKDKNELLKFGIINGISDLVALFLIINLCVFIYSTRILVTLFNKISKKIKKNKPTMNLISENNLDSNINKSNSEISDVNNNKNEIMEKNNER